MRRVIVHLDRRIRTRRVHSHPVVTIIGPPAEIGGDLDQIHAVTTNGHASGRNGRA